MRGSLIGMAALGSAVVAGVAWWREHPRVGAGYVNRVVDPWLIRIGVLDESRGELGLVEHVGRRSGTTRLTPVHPVVTEEGYRIVVPLGVQSEWARNVLAAGGCRMQVGGTVHDLDAPALVSPAVVADIPGPISAFMEWLGFRYLVLHRRAEHPGRLDRPMELRSAVPVAVPSAA